MLGNATLWVVVGALIYVAGPIAIAFWKRSLSRRFLAGGIVTAYLAPPALFLGVGILEDLIPLEVVTALPVVLLIYMAGIYGVWSVFLSETSLKDVALFQAPVIVLLAVVLPALMLAWDPSPPSPPVVPQPEVETELACYTAYGDGEQGVFELSMVNTGQMALDLAPAEVLVRMPDGELNRTLSRRPQTLEAGGLPEDITLLDVDENWAEPDSFAVYQINGTGPLRTGTEYTVEVVLTEMDHTIDATCTAERR